MGSKTAENLNDYLITSTQLLEEIQVHVKNTPTLILSTEDDKYENPK